MAIKMVGKCKQCGADVHLDEDQEKGFCQYCGAEFVVKEGGGAIGNITSFLNKADKHHMEYKENEARRRDERGREKREKGGKAMMGMLIVCLLLLFLMYFMNRLGM